MYRNPFIDRTFSGLYASTASLHNNDNQTKTYFVHNSSMNEIHKPGFLIKKNPQQFSLMFGASNVKQPLIGSSQIKPKPKYLQNPFLKGTLIQNQVFHIKTGSGGYSHIPKYQQSDYSAYKTTPYNGSYSTQYKQPTNKPYNNKNEPHTNNYKYDLDGYKNNRFSNLSDEICLEDSQQLMFQDYKSKVYKPGKNQTKRSQVKNYQDNPIQNCYDGEQSPLNSRYPSFGIPKASNHKNQSKALNSNNSIKLNQQIMPPSDKNGMEQITSSKWPSISNKNEKPKTSNINLKVTQSLMYENKPNEFFYKGATYYKINIENRNKDYQDEL